MLQAFLADVDKTAGVVASHLYKLLCTAHHDRAAYTYIVCNARQLTLLLLLLTHCMHTLAYSLSVASGWHSRLCRQ
jgi:hypothetical protein